MLVLAIDTATMASSVALATEGRLEAELTVETGNTHSETLLAHIEQILLMAGRTKKELDAVAVSIGPGSFTGLRIGLSTAKALSYGLSIPLVTVSTMEALAAHFPMEGARVGVLLDAQKKHAYAALYAHEHGELRPIIEPCVAVYQDFIASLEEHAPVVLVGDLPQKKRAGLACPKGVSIAPPELIMPRAATVARLGLADLRAGRTADAMMAEPLYIRRSEAEVLWEERHKSRTNPS
ncbi:tRNA (adenosine(37)-N6)-threonylcarbamoyltransferase complex dimerization subunit type 1 TsaB [Selenomonas sp. TAMA-11512]|uniref:tRNA (adenosine(37)-N6)-threonylcarbamoyltransferase complex dimerization subunit type 1 TsaB n=1 Tax=Selenomonas sp. TAMA-11512 TaxID=3095337 RepID=UPI003087F90E|nr:tRNA (adenosine(37)-N6)-threonylcarbamoyltransferase complex dimerization subunit type 1 TsaB [Selenomonas sp. TAMA-11512]